MPDLTERNMDRGT